MPVVSSERRKAHSDLSPSKNLIQKDSQTATIGMRDSTLCFPLIVVVGGPECVGFCVSSCENCPPSPTTLTKEHDVLAGESNRFQVDESLVACLVQSVGFSQFRLSSGAAPGSDGFTALGPLKPHWKVASFRVLRRLTPFIRVPPHVLSN